MWQWDIPEYTLRNLGKNFNVAHSSANFYCVSPFLATCTAKDTHKTCCTEHHRCDELEGNCEIDNHCRNGLKCGLCPVEFPKNYKCCYKEICK